MSKASDELSRIKNMDPWTTDTVVVCQDYQRDILRVPNGYVLITYRKYIEGKPSTITELFIPFLPRR